MESLTFQERLQRWNNPTTLEEFSVTARAATKQSEVVCSPSRYEEKKLTVDRHALKELAFQMAVEGKQLGVQLDSLHETLSEETLKCEHQETLSADLRKRTCGIGKEVRALGRRVEELQELLRKGKENTAEDSGRRSKNVSLTKPTDQWSLEELKARLEILETEKQEMLQERKDWEREIQFLKCQLQYREEMKALQERNDSAKLEEDNALLKKENHDLRQKLDSLTDVTRKLGFTADNEEHSMSLNSPSEAGESRKSVLESELEILRKERKILLATVLKQQTAEKDSPKRNGTVNCDGGQSVSVASEGDELRKKVERFQAEIEDLEKDNKTLDGENTRLIEEKRSLEDQVNKLKSQIADALESNFDEIEHLNQSIEDLQEKLNLLQGQNKRLREASNVFKEKCASHFETALAEIEEKQSYEDVLDYLTDAIDQLLEFDDEATALTVNELDVPQQPTERAASSNFLEEIKMCKDLIENQRQQIRQIQFDKRDLEESLSKMKRELSFLKSEKRHEKRQGVVQASQNESKAEEGYKTTQQEKGYLKSRQTELESLAKTLKEDNCKLENEKFCLLGSFYHLLERNEALEEQVAKMKQSDVITTDKTAEHPQGKEKFSDEGGLTRPAEDAKDESTDDLKCEIQRIGDGLRDVQEFVLDAEGEKKKLKDELGERKKSDEEFRAVVMQLNQELTVLKGRVEKVQEMNDTLQDCLREVQDEKQELVASLGESNEEKVVLEKSLADMEDKVNSLEREIDALQNDAGHCHEKTDKARQHLKVVCEKLSELFTVLAREEASPPQPMETKEPKESESEPEIEELCKRSSLILDKVVKETERLRTARERYKLDAAKLKIRVDALLIEKQALQRYVRELDERKRQMKVFITRLTEEKEALAEDIDEIKQQKMNLADALENVYHNKEGVQSKLEEATLKVEQLKASLRQGAEESKTLRESLCRVVKDRDAVKVALLAEKQQVERLRESEGKWRELAMGSHTEADQIIEVDRAIKEEMVYGRLKVEESQTIAELKAERDELLKRVDSILTAKKATKVVDDDVENDLDTDSVSMGEIKLDKERVTNSLQNDEEEEREDAASITAEHLMPLQNCAEFADKKEVPIRASGSPIDSEKWREEKEALAEIIKQSAEETEQLRNWLDAVFVEKGRLEQELENTSEENKDLIRDLQRSSDEKEKLTLLLKKRSEDKESQVDESNVLEDKDGQQKQDLDQEDASKKQLEEVHDCEEKSSDSLEQTVEELTEKPATMATDLERAQKDIRDLTNQISIIQRENGKHVASLEQVTESSRAMDKKCKQLMEDNQRLKDLDTESVQQAESLRLDNGKLSESNKRLTEDLKNSRKTLEKTLQKAQELRKEIKTLSENNQSLKTDVKRAKEQESELNAVNEMSEAKCRQLADELERLKATAKEKVEAEETLHTLEEEFEKSKSDLMMKEEKLSMIEDGLQNLLSTAEVGTSVAEENQLHKEAMLQDPLNQLKAVRQTLERRAEETKEFENCLNCVQQKVNELKAFTKSLEFEELRRNSLTDEPMQSYKNKTNYKIVSETIKNTLEGVQRGFAEILSQKAMAAKKLEREIVTSEKKAVELASELDKLREELSVARKSNEDVNSACKELEKEQDKVKHAERESKLAEKTNQKLRQELQAAKNTITELRTEKANITALLTEKEKHLEVVTSEKVQALEEMNNEVTSLAAAKNDLEKALKDAEESVCDSKRQLEQSRKLTRSLREEIEGASKQLRKRQSENEDLKLCVSKMDKEKSNRQKVLKDLESKNLALQKRVKETEDDNSKLAENNRELAAHKRERETALNEVREGKSNLEKKLKEQAESSKSTLSKTRKELNKSQEERKDLKACVASLDKDKRTLQKLLKDIETKLEKAEKEQDSLVERSNDEQLRIKNLEDLLKIATEEKESSHSSNQEREEENRRLNERKQELDSRIKEMDAEVRRVTDGKKRLEKELTSEKSISADLRLRVGEANDDKNELEEILEQQRNNYKNLKDELKKTAFQKRAIEGKLNSALANLEKAEDELRGKTSYSEERDAKLRQSEDEIKILRRKLEENSEEVCAVRKILKERTSDGERKDRNAEIKRIEGQEISQLETEVSSIVQKNEDLSERLNEADAKISVLEKKLQQQDEERDDNKKRIERSQQASSRLDVALESAKEEESRLRRQLEESKDSERALKTQLQEMIEQVEQISPPRPSAVQQECALERVLVTCADVPELTQFPNESSTYIEDKYNAPNVVSAKKEVVLLESQVRKLRSELRMAKDQVFDLQQDLSDSKRALRQKERLHQQERSRFQEDIEDIERECDQLRKKLLSLGEVEARRSSFSTVKDLKGTLRKAESDMWDVISKTAGLLERAKGEMKEVTGREEKKPAIPRTKLHSSKSNEEKEDLRKRVQDLEKQKDQLEKTVRRAEGLKETLKQTLVDTLADVHKFRCLVYLGSESSDINANETTTLRKKPGQEEIKVQSDQKACNVQEAEQLCGQLEELRKIIKGLEKSLADEKSKDYMRGKSKLEVVNQNLRQLLRESEQDGEESLKREKKLEELLLRSQFENTAKVNAKHEVQGLGGHNELHDRLRESESRVQDLTNEMHQVKCENGELRFECERLKKEAVCVPENEKLQQDGVRSRDEDSRNESTVPEFTLHKTLEAVQVLQTEKEALEAQCSVLQGKVREVAEGKNQLLEDAVSFKVKYLKKNQKLTSLLETKEHEVISLQTKNEGLTSLMQKMEDDLLQSEKDVETLRLQSQAATSEKERVERINEEQQFELGSFRMRHDELNAKLEHLSSEISKLEDLNKALLEEKSQVAQEYGVEKAELLQERDAIASRLREMEEENKLESSLKEVREDHLREKERKLAKDSASIKKEKENLGNVTTKIQQMRDEYTRLESEYNVLLESINETRQENTTLRKENSLVRKACDQLRARKTAVAEEKVLEEVNEVEVESIPPLEHKPKRAIIRENVIPLHRAAAKEDDLPHISDYKSFKRHSIAHSTTDHTEGLLIPISLSGQKRDTFLDRRRACSLPTQQETKTAQGRAEIKSASHNAPQSPLSSSAGSSSRSSEADSSVCSRRHYCSPILSVVDLCPLHHGFPLERKPSPCPVCRKKKERKTPKEPFVSSEKYV